MPKNKASIIVNHRNAISGRFVKASYVKSHPSTTTTEHNRRAPTTTKPSRKK